MVSMRDGARVIVRYREQTKKGHGMMYAAGQGEFLDVGTVGKQ